MSEVQTPLNACPGTITISSRRESDLAIIEIEDDGRGLDGNGQPAGGGNGLLGMRERAAALGGDLEAGPLAAGGFGVRARLPLDGAA